MFSKLAGELKQVAVAARNAEDPSISERIDRAAEYVLENDLAVLSALRELEDGLRNVQYEMFLSDPAKKAAQLKDAIAHIRSARVLINELMEGDSERLDP